MMVCYAGKTNQLKPVEGISGSRPFCVATSAGFLFGVLKMVKLEVGEKHGQLLYLGFIETDKHNRRLGLFTCDCGKSTISAIGRVKGGYIKSCGCLKYAQKNLTHGMTHTKEYRTWISIKNRASNLNSKDYPKYSILDNDDDILSNFKSFLDEVGLCPKDKYSIDRINTKIGYKKGNMRWATRSEQQNNKTNSYFVIIKGMRFDGLVSAAKYFNVTKHSVRNWCFGWTDKRRNKIWKKKAWAKVEKKYT